MEPQQAIPRYTKRKKAGQIKAKTTSSHNFCHIHVHWPREKRFYISRMVNNKLEQYMDMLLPTILIKITLLKIDTKGTTIGVWLDWWVAERETDLFQLSPTDLSLALFVLFFFIICFVSGSFGANSPCQELSQICLPFSTACFKLSKRILDPLSLICSFFWRVRERLRRFP